jgi:hypothetical protein
MLSRLSIAAVACALALHTLSSASAQTSAQNWYQYVADGTMSVVDVADGVAKGLDATAKVGGTVTNFASPAVGYTSGVLQAVEFGINAAQRAATYNISASQALLQQAVIDGSGMVVSQSLNTALAGCFATGACALSAAAGTATTVGTLGIIAGIPVDAYLVNKAVEAGIDLQLSNQKLAQTQKINQQLQQEVDQINFSKQLQTLQPVSQPRVQTNLQPPPPAQSIPQTTITTIIPGRPPTVQPTQVATGSANTNTAQSGQTQFGVTVTAVQIGIAGNVKIMSLVPVITEAPGNTQLAASGNASGQGGYMQSNQLRTGTNVPSAPRVTVITPGNAPNNVITTIVPGNAHTNALSTIASGTTAPASQPRNPNVTVITPGNGPENTIVQIIPGNGPTNPPPKPITPQSNAQSSTPYLYSRPAAGAGGGQGLVVRAPQQPALNTAQLASLKSEADALKVPSVPPPPAYTPPPPAPITTLTVRPGGISLSLAAAMRMHLSLDLDGMYFKDGKIVLTGAHQDENRIDAALFLSALRAGCEPGDPYFSLDADDGSLWLDEGRQFSDRLLDQIETNIPWWKRFDPTLPRGLTFRVISAQREFRALWAALAPSYPHFKSRLVFRPEWLRQTRFGETLYNADVLLKELASGAPVLDTSTGVRAQTIDRYVSADARSAAKSLLSSVAGGPSHAPARQTSRLWFDLVPQAEAPRPDQLSAVFDPKASNLTVGAAGDLYRTLLTRGYLTTPEPSDRPIILASDDNALDLSHIYPKMFVRLTDLAARRDLQGRNPDLDQLATDVTQRVNLYAQAYPELRALVDVFRAYIVAVKIVERDPSTCGHVRSIPLLAAERVSQPLPQYRPSDIFFTFGAYSYFSDGQRRQQAVESESEQGGISLSGKTFYAVNVQRGLRTTITQHLNEEAALPNHVPDWRESSGRQFIEMQIDSGALLSAAGLLNGAQNSTPEEVLRKQQDIQAVWADHERQQREQGAKKAYEARVAQWQELKANIEQQESQWREAQARWQDASRKAAEKESVQRLAAQYGPALDSKTAVIALPYVRLAIDAAEASTNVAHMVGGLQLSWEIPFRRAGYSERQIQLIRSSGFFAAIYEDGRTGEVTIAYGQQAAPKAFGLNRIANIDLQHDAAITLAILVRKDWSYAPLSLTGYGYGGELAAFAGEQLGMSHVVTFNNPQLYPNPQSSR